MKQGSTDDPFAEDADTESEEAPDSGEHTEAETDRAGVEESNGVGTEQPPIGGDTEPDEDRGQSEDRQMRSLPYIHARDGVKDGRTQRPVFLRDHIEAGIDELVMQMESELGEDVYKTDVTEAAMAIAQENPELVLAKLEEWGYGLT